MNLLVSILIDQIYFISLFFLPIFNNFYNHLITTFEFNSLILTHPEYYFIYKNYLNIFYQNYFANIYLSIYTFNLNESYISSIMFISQFFFIFMLILFLIIVYFNYYNNYNTEDNIIDHDYLTYNITIEAEEEVGSIDDMILASVILIYVFF